MSKHILPERQHIADELVAALDLIYELDLALASDLISLTERDRLDAERSFLNAEILR